MPNDVQLESLVDRSPRQIAALLEDAYRDYVVPVRFPVEAFVAGLRQDSVDLAASRIARVGTLDAGLAIVALRGNATRLAALAVAPEHRGRGFGARLLDAVLDGARARGDRLCELEVIEGNVAAVGLYESRSFVTRRRLLQFGARRAAPRSRNGSPGDRPPALEQGTAAEVVDNRALGAVVVRHALGDLPWQVSGWTLAQSVAPLVSYRLEAAWAAVDLVVPARLRLRSLVVEPSARRRGQARRLLDAIERLHPGRSWFVTAHCPEELAEPMRRLGFIRTPEDIAQRHMVLPLARTTARRLDPP